MSMPTHDLCQLKWELDRIEDAVGHVINVLAQNRLDPPPELVHLRELFENFARDFTLVAESLTNRTFSSEFVELKRRKSSLGEASANSLLSKEIIRGA